jgi:hypothetical protein
MTGTKQAKHSKPEYVLLKATVTSGNSCKSMAAPGGFSCCCKACNVLQLNVQFNHAALRDTRTRVCYCSSTVQREADNSRSLACYFLCCHRCVVPSQRHIVEEIRCGRVCNCHFWLSVCLPFLVPLFSIII